jgi:NB-ARC domain/Leucine Rich Repeat
MLILQVIKGFFTDENSVLFRYKASKKLTKVLGKIDEIVTEMNQFNFTTHPPVNTIDRETQSSVMESEVIGREGERDEIVNALLDPQRERDDNSVLAIVGMGGLGKTTLAQLVFNHEGVKGHFKLLMWVCVSTDFNVVNILKLIIQAAQKGGDISASSKEVLQQRLHEILDKKKYLLVLDDVWNEAREKWEELKTLLSSRANAGSVVIVTTRSKTVASIMGTLPDCDLAKLIEKDSRTLFEKRAFGSVVKEPSEALLEIGRNIVHKCGGLPLAVKAMGGLMGTKPDIKDWRVVAENNKIWEGLASSENILPLLKLSYDHLPSYMKQCFMFCAVFPQDYLIERDMLIRLWMANDFIPTDGTMDLEDKGRHIFNELYLRSFFQDLKYEKRGYGSITTTCKMHDLMHDLATQVAGEKCSTQMKQNNSGTTQEEVQHLLISPYYSSIKGIEASVLKQFPNIHTFLVNDILKQAKKYSYLLKSSSLRALGFRIRDISLPKELGYMRHLRYLDLSFCFNFHALPESISKLYNLQTLDVSNSEICELPEGVRYLTNLRHLFLKNCCSLERLPNGMRYMTKLRHVYLGGCNNLKWMPIGIGQLKCLRTLTNYVVDPDKGGSIGELKNLNDLCGHLSLSGLEKIRDKGDAEAANFAAKSNLYSLELRWEGELRETGENEQAVLEALGPHSELKFLKINGFSGSSFPKWSKEPFITNNLKSLRLIECINYAEISLVLQLHLLEELYLKELKSLTYIVTGSCKNADRMIFPSLKRLEMVKMPNLEGWHERDIKMVNFPNLVSLEIDRCPKLKFVPIHAPLLRRLIVKDSREIKLREMLNISMLSDLNIKIDFPPTETDAFRLPKTLEELRIEGFENVNPLADQAKEKQSCEANALRYLTIVASNCFLSCGYGPGWTELGTLGFWKQFAALEYLNIKSCKSLVYWPQDELRNLKCLRALYFSKCEKFTGSLSMPVSSSPILIPQLKTLSVENCPELVQIPSCSILLETLWIENCPKLFYGEGVLASLTELQHLLLSDCGNLRAWPDNMGHLPSLKHLSISNCTVIESFSESLQQCVPSLQYLSIYKCPALERRCRRGGDYCHLVLSIPELYIHEEITKSQSILGRLLPRRWR